MRLHLRNLASRILGRAGSASNPRANVPRSVPHATTAIRRPPQNGAAQNGSAAIEGRLEIRPFQSNDGHGFDLIRTDCEPTDVVAVVYDGADRGVGEALQYARLLALAPAMQALLTRLCPFGVG